MLYTQKLAPAARLLVQRRSRPLATRVAKFYVPSAISCSRSLVAPSSLSTRSFCSRLPAPSSSHTRTYSSTSGVVEDEDRPGLFYHPVNGNLFALSFLSDKPASQNSATVIGLIPEDKGLDEFEENQAFVDLLHDTVKSALTENVDPDLANDATQRQEGWMHVHDMRNFPESGRVGDADDIIGSVLVQDGKIKGETYERMPSYRTCTADGPINLSPGVHERLVSALKEVHQKESKA